MKALLNLIFPPLCPLCKTVVSESMTVCADCWKDIVFIADPFCIQCTLPFDTALPEEVSHQKCGKCLRAPPSFSKARAVYLYNAPSKKILLSFKHGAALHLAPFFSKGLWNVGQDILESTDVLIPIPLHWRRLYKRGFNQSAILAQQLGKLSKKPVEVSLLKRMRHTPPQGALSLEERNKNVRGCFKVISPQKLLNKTITLVDDVMTTGATLNAASETLLKAGAKEVSALCVARVAE